MSTAELPLLPLKESWLLKKHVVDARYKLTRGTQSNSDEYENNQHDISGALRVRRQWMAMMGLSDEEIDNHCQPGTIADLDEELAEYAALIRVHARNQKVRERHAG